MDPKNLEEGIKLLCSDRRLMTQRTKTEPPAYNQISESDCFLQKKETENSSYHPRQKQKGSKSMPKILGKKKKPSVKKKETSFLHHM